MAEPIYYWFGIIFQCTMKIFHVTASYGNDLKSFVNLSFLAIERDHSGIYWYTGPSIENSGTPNRIVSEKL